jgi:hypothetical protein
MTLSLREWLGRESLSQYLSVSARELDPDHAPARRPAEPDFFLTLSGLCLQAAEARKGSRTVSSCKPMAAARLSHMDYGSWTVMVADRKFGQAGWRTQDLLPPCRPYPIVCDALCSCVWAVRRSVHPSPEKTCRAGRPQVPLGRTIQVLARLERSDDDVTGRRWNPRWTGAGPAGKQDGAQRLAGLFREHGRVGMAPCRATAVGKGEGKKIGTYLGDPQEQVPSQPANNPGQPLIPHQIAPDNAAPESGSSWCEFCEPFHQNKRHHHPPFRLPLPLAPSGLEVQLHPPPPLPPP